MKKNLSDLQQNFIFPSGHLQFQLATYSSMNTRGDLRVVYLNRVAHRILSGSKSRKEYHMNKFPRQVGILLGASVAFLATGCASIIHGTRQSVMVTSTPPATVKLDGVVQGESPLKLQLRRGDRTQEVKLEKEGCQPSSVSVVRKFSAWYIGNIVFGGAIGIIVDAADGAMWRRAPESVDILLRCPIASAPTPALKEGAEIPVPR